MKKITALMTTLLLFTLVARADEYRGFIGDMPIHASINDDYDYGVYMYDKYNEPIRWITYGGSIPSTEKMVFQEGYDYKHPKNPPRATLTLKTNPINSDQLNGVWTDYATQKNHPITLTRYAEPAGSLQSDTFKNAYFRKTCAGESGKIVRIFDKKTKQLMVTVDAGGAECRGDEVDVGDYNFDGYEDFSVFDSNFAGANTTKAYYIYHPKTRHYEYSDQLTDVSLSFNAKTKTVTSTNQCCAGSQYLILHSKWQDKQLKLQRKECLKWNAKKEQLVKAKPNACD